MSVELHADEWVDRSAGEPRDGTRPNVSGDLPSVFSAAPMFRRTVAGYDRFQVDTYVRWAEDELATADREREHLMARHLSTTAALGAARELLAHSAGGGEMLRLSRRTGVLLAAAADEAAGIRADAEEDRRAAAEQAERMLLDAEQMVLDAEQMVLDAESEAEQLVTDAEADAAARHAEAVRTVEEAEQAAAKARAEAKARLAKVRSTERRAAERIQEHRRDVDLELTAARLQARDEVVRLLGMAREQRRRADDAAMALRARLDREAAARRTALLADVDALELRRAVLRAEIDQLTGPVTAPPESRLDVQLRRLVERVRSRPVRTP